MFELWNRFLKSDFLQKRSQIDKNFRPVFFILDIYLNFLRYRKKFKILYLNFLDLVEKNLETFFTEIMFWKVKKSLNERPMAIFFACGALKK